MDKSLKRKRIVGYTIFYVIFAILFVYGTIGLNDLNFDKMVFNPSNKFAFTMACYGMFPRYTMQLLGYATLMAVYRPYEQALDVAQSLFPFFKFFRQNKVIYKILGFLYKVLFVAFIYGAFMGTKDILDFFGYYDSIVSTGIPIAVVNGIFNLTRIALIVISYILLKKIAKKYAREIELMAVAGLALYYASDVINMLKEHFHRIRFREMVAYSNGIVGDDGAVHSLHDVVFTRSMIDKTDFHWFTNWYIVGKDDGVVWHDPRSFPSGHTSAASFTFLLVPLFSKTKELSKYFVPASVLGIGYVMAMGLSRMMRGAHYMTDVTGAGLIMFTMMIAFVFVLERLQERSDKRLPKHE